MARSTSNFTDPPLSSIGAEKFVGRNYIPILRRAAKLDFMLSQSGNSGGAVRFCIRECHEIVSLARERRA
jgi:hypothetical protein